MKKVIIGFICLLLVFLFAVIYILINDSNYQNKLKNDIINNTDIKEINYLNKYNNYYIVMDLEYLYLFDLKYNEILSKDINLMHSNDKKYDIIYKDDNFMYFNDYKKGNRVIYEYYSIDTYKLIDKIYIGG